MSRPLESAVFHGLQPTLETIRKLKDRGVNVSTMIELLKKIDIQAMNTIANTETYRKRIQVHEKIEGSIRDFTIRLISDVEREINSHILASPLRYIRTRRQKEKVAIINFYKKYAIDILYMYTLYNMIIEAKEDMHAKTTEE